jgi:TolA-binding protein
VKNLLQILLTKPEELESLERLLYDRVQQNPGSEVYADLLIWVNLQQKNFYGAYVQARAYDRRFKKDVPKTLEIAQIALNNLDYENADKGFTYVAKEYANTDNYLPARLGQIKAREAKVKRKFPVNKDSIRFVLGEYESFVAKYPDNQNAHDAQLSEASLFAYYLDEKDSAVSRLNRLITNPRASLQTKAKAKLELGDLYLLKGEPWESTLLYSQVERMQKDAPIGYDAKLRNAKLSYYKGEFNLAQEHLDILKQATTREIANDAMELSMRINENIALDSAGEALKIYARAELDLLQNNVEAAIIKLKEIEEKYPSNTLKDDVYWLEANLEMRRGNFEQSVALLQKILDEFGEDILADDAYFLQADIYQHQLKNNEKAQEMYREFLNKYPGSVYVAEARKRFRELRGDFDSVPINH